MFNVPIQFPAEFISDINKTYIVEELNHTFYILLDIGIKSFSIDLPVIDDKTVTLDIFYDEVISSNHYSITLKIGYIEPTVAHDINTKEEKGYYYFLLEAKHKIFESLNKIPIVEFKLYKVDKSFSRYSYITKENISIYKDIEEEFDFTSIKMGKENESNENT